MDLDACKAELEKEGLAAGRVERIAQRSAQLESS